MPSASYNSLTKSKPAKRRRTGSNVTKVRYGSTSASSQRQQILSNARAIAYIRKMAPEPIICDYQLKGAQYAKMSGSPAFTTTVASTPLMSPTLWNPVMRNSDLVENCASTKITDMEMNLRYTLKGSNWAQFTVFIVSLQEQAANKNVPNGLILGDDYIQGASDYNIRLNPAVFDVKYSRNVSLMKNGWEDQATVIGTTPFAGQPSETLRKGQVSLRLNTYLRQPTGINWRDMIMEQLKPSQKLYLLTFITQQSIDDTELSGARLDFDALYHTYNAS